MKKQKIAGQFVRFALVGGFCTVLHYGVYYLLQRLIEINTAYTIGYAAGFVANFYLTSYFTFGTLPSWRNLIGMGGAHIVNYILHLVLLNLFLWLGLSPAWAPIPVYAIAIPTNFLLVRFVFTHKSKNNESD